MSSHSLNPAGNLHDQINADGSYVIVRGGPDNGGVDTGHQFRGWVIWTWNAPGAQEIGNVLGGSSSEYIASLGQWEPPAWSRLRQLPIYERLVPVGFQTDRAFGLPVLSVWYGFDAKRVLGTSLVLSREVIGSLPYRDLAVTPIWPGFAINTIFYGAILWLLIPGQFALRRLIRRKRGLCIACRYDLRGAEHEVCPECGAVTTVSVVQ